ncbi:MAG: hypothetical protein JOZ05_13715 [Acetobacteraceae bacterium]|nr:hypothetical protein [Acetobacteraceae bacterium]
MTETCPLPLLRQFLAWIAARPRTYGETMDAWRTSCPRLAVWEEATAEGLVELSAAATQSACAVTLTDRGTAVLEQPA